MGKRRIDDLILQLDLNTRRMELLDTAIAQAELDKVKAKLDKIK